MFCYVLTFTYVSFLSKLCVFSNLVRDQGHVGKLTLFLHKAH